MFSALVLISVSVWNRCGSKPICQDACPLAVRPTSPTIVLENHKSQVQDNVHSQVIFISVALYTKQLHSNKHEIVNMTLVEVKH